MSRGDADRRPYHAGSALRPLIAGASQPDSIAGWKALADGFLTGEACAFHRNVEISSRYAWVHMLLPACFKWAGMAAIASHHVRLALFPLRLDTDRTGYVDLARSLGRRRLLLMEDVNTIRAKAQRRPRRLGNAPTTSSGMARSRSSSTSSAPWYSPTSIDSRAPSRAWSPSVRPPRSRSAECGANFRTSPPSTCTR
jgi:hypothetical protein